MTNFRTPWRAVAAMFILNGALFGIWASRIPAVAEQHALSPGNLGALLLLMAAGAICAFPLAGRMSDRLGSAKVTWWISIAYAVCLALIAFAPTYIALAFALFAFGATHGAMDVSMNTWAGEVERHIGRPVMSSFHAMFSFGAGVGAASGYIAATYMAPISTHFCIAGAAVAAITLWVANIEWASQTREQSENAPLFAFPKGALLAVGFVAFCSSLGEGAMADWSAIFLVLVTSASEANAALGYAVFSISMVCMRLMGDRVTLKLGPVNAAKLAGLTSALGVFIAVFFATYASALLGFALMGIGYAVIMPLAFSRAANDPVLSPGAAIASVSTLGYGGILLGPPLIGFLSEATSIRAAFALLGVLAVAIIVMSGAVKRAN